MALTNYAKNLLASALCARAPVLPTQVFLGLGTGTSPAGLVGEPAGNGYARQRVTFTGSGVQSNTETLRFGFTAAAGTLTAAGLFDSATGGNALTAATLTAAVSVAGPGTVTINPADLDIEAIGV